MTPIIIITGLVIALSASMWRNTKKRLLKKRRCLKGRNRLLRPCLTNRWYDPDDYTDLTSHQIKRIGERS